MCSLGCVCVCGGKQTLSSGPGCCHPINLAPAARTLCVCVCVGESTPYPEPEDKRVPTKDYKWLTIEQVRFFCDSLPVVAALTAVGDSSHTLLSVCSLRLLAAGARCWPANDQAHNGCTLFFNCHVCCSAFLHCIALCTAHCPAGDRGHSHSCTACAQAEGRACSSTKHCDRRQLWG